MFVPDLFTEEEYLELGNASSISKEHKCICSRSEAFIPEVSSQIEGLSAIISKEWTEEAEASSSIIQIYSNPRVLFAILGMLDHKKLFTTRRSG